MGRIGRTTDDDDYEDDGPSVGLDQRWKKGGEINSEERNKSKFSSKGSIVAILIKNSIEVMCKFNFNVQRMCLNQIQIKQAKSYLVVQ